MPRKYHVSKRIGPTRRGVRGPTNRGVSVNENNIIENCRSLRSSWEYLGDAIEHLRSAGDKGGDFTEEIRGMEELRENIDIQIRRGCGNVNTGATYGGKRTRRRRATRRGVRK